VLDIIANRASGAAPRLARLDYLLLAIDSPNGDGAVIVAFRDAAEYGLCSARAVLFVAFRKVSHLPP
jgi:hypothetical protein